MFRSLSAVSGSVWIGSCPTPLAAHQPCQNACPNGTEKSKGTKVFALAGKVRHAGLVEVPLGTTLRHKSRRS